MFYDERIHAGRGRAFRKTLIFTTVVFCLYLCLHLLVMLAIAHQPFSLTAILAELVPSLLGLSLILYGETGFGEKGRDEMQQAAQNRFYAKAFYWFLYVFAGCYCLAAPVRFLYGSSDPTYAQFPPNGILWVAELPCWFFLLWQFKQEDLPMNSSVLADTVGSYWRYVWKNILKFGGLCLGFTLMSFLYTFLSMMLATRNLVLTAGVLLTILLIGFTTWFSFSAEYLLYSLAERASDRAQERGIFSGFTKGFLIANGIATIISSFFSHSGIILVNRFAPLSMPFGMSYGQMLMLFSYFNTSLAVLSTFINLTAIIYFFSELRTLKDRRLDRTFNRMIFLTLLLMIFQSLVTRLLTSTIQIQDSLYGSTDTLHRMISLINLNNLCVCTLSLVALALTAVFHILLCVRIADHGYARKGWIWLPITTFFCGLWVNLFSLIGRSSSLPGAIIFEVIGITVTSIFEIVYLMKILKNAKEKPMITEE